jgi:MFS family permease
MFMTSVSGLLKIGEAQATMRDIGKRTRGSAYIYTFLLLAMVIGGMIAGAVVAQLIFLAFDAEKVPYDSVVWSIILVWLGVAAGFTAYCKFAMRLLVRRHKKRLIEKGMSPECPLSLEIAPDALLYEVGDEKRIAKWSSVSELFMSHHYWIFLVQSAPYFLPTRFFANHNTEAAFIAEALAHMNEAARARSRDAVAFVGAK